MTQNEIARALDAPNPGQGLQRRLGLFSLTSLVMANMFGAGILTMTGFLAGAVPQPLLLLGLWLVGGLTALCGAVCYGRLAAAMPCSGGEYFFLSRLYHPLAGFLSGWISFIVGFAAPIAAAAVAVVEYLARAWPFFASWGVFYDPAAQAIVKKIDAILIIALFTAVHRKGLGFGAGVQNGLAAVKVAFVALFVIGGFLFGAGDFGRLAEGAGLVPGLAGCKRIGLALLWILFAYSGWNASVYVGSETRMPKRNLPRSLLIGCGAVTLLYLSLNLLYFYAIPPRQLAGTLPIGGLAAAHLFGRPLERLLSSLIALILCSSICAYILLGPRVTYAMARDRLFFAFAGRLDPRRRLPAAAVLFQGATAAVMVVLGSFDQLLTYLGFALALSPILAVVGVFKLDHRQQVRPAFAARILAPAFFLAVSLFALGSAFLERPGESLLALATLALGVPGYYSFLALRRSAGGSRKLLSRLVIPVRAGTAAWKR